MTTYAEATTARTSAEILTTNLATAAAEGVNVAGFDDFSPTRAQFELEARAMAAEEGIRVKLTHAGYLTTAALAGEDFFDQALTWYDLDNGYGGKGRIPATYAVWSLPIVVDANNGPYTLSTNSHELIAQAEDSTIFQSTNESPVELPTGTTTMVQFTATTPGTVGNPTAGTIGHLIVAFPGVQISTITTHVQTVFARNVETTSEATRRAIGKWATLGAGWTATSFDYLIPLMAPTVTRWRVRTDNPNGPGTIELVLANAAGPSSPSENAAVVAGLTAPAVMTLGTGGLTAVSATTKAVPLIGTLYSDGTNPTFQADATVALLALQNGFPIGGDADGLLRLDLVTTVLMGGAFPQSNPLIIQSTDGATVTIILPGFKGAKELVLTSPVVNQVFAATDVLSFAGSNVVFA